MGADAGFYITAIMHLMSCRDIGMAVGPIKWNIVYQYCLAVGFWDWERLFNIANQVDLALRDDK